MRSTDSKATATKQNTKTMSLADKIADKTALVGVVGLGYVGLPLAVALAKSSFKVTGIDLDKDRVSTINNGKSYISDVTQDSVANVVKLKNLKATADFKAMTDLDVILICVPTPITKAKVPDLSYVVSAAEEVAKIIRKDQLIVLESTTYPGTTEEIVLPMLSESGLKAGEDFYLAFSPERVDPGNRRFNIHNTPKIVGGVTHDCGLFAERFYGTIVEKVVRVSSPRVAETAKLFENVFRNANIALVNELSILCHKMGISACEVVDAASTKPFGFTRFNPGPGVGGHCIPVDPYYLAAKAKEYDFHTRFIALSGEINENMPYYVVERIGEALNAQEKALNGSKVLILGVTYKKDIADLRESPAIRIINSLMERGSVVSYHDPYIKRLNISGNTFCSVSLTETILMEQDCAVIITDHTCYDYREIARFSPLLVDTRNATGYLNGSEGNVIRF